MEILANQQELLNQEDFLKCKSLEKKLENLNSYWKVNEKIFQGTVSIIDNKNNYFLVKNITTLDGKKRLLNPFTGKELTIKSNLSEIEDLKKEDNIAFELVPISTKKREDYGPVNIKYNSAIKIEDIETFCSETDSKIADIINIIKSNKNMKIYKVLVNSEAFHEDAKKIYSEELSKSKIEKEELFLKIEECKRKLEDINKDIENEKRERQELINLGILKEPKIQYKNNEKIDLSKEEQINYLTKYLSSSYKTNLYHNKETIKQLYSALSTNQITILSGSPGTGKTSLIEGFCDACGINKKIISVQPDWSENQDLIGFYNPIDKKYIPTPFLDFLIEARKNPTDLFIVCFDEMNLAHIEYYFSEFLSKLESEDRELELYSKNIYDENRKNTEIQLKFIKKKYEINFENDLVKVDDIDMLEKYNKLHSQLENYINYNYKIKIPENIRFVGTINKDETTKNLSPKVIDRSFIMEIEKYKEESVQTMIDDSEQYNKPLYLNSNDFKPSLTEIPQELINDLNKIDKFLEEEFNINLNKRFYRQVSELISSSIFNHDEVIDFIYLSKIIPKINLYIEEKDRTKIDNFDALLINKVNSKKTFEKMKNSWEKTEVLTFWRK
ncbi:hypothetical protein KW94_04145 [Clostridioides difficile]|nr:hypothetical protein KW94_04145 [Clostridioides difficile]